MGVGVFNYLGEIQAVERVLAEVDLLIMPSRNEGMPFALLEAMAAGCGVAGYGVGGIPEVGTSDRSLGSLSRPGDLEGLLRSVLDFVQRPELATVMGVRASEHVRSQFRLEERLPLIASAHRMARGVGRASFEVGSPEWFKKCT